MPHESRLHSGDSIPHYHIMSKKAVHEGGTLHVPINWMRKFFIESIYRRLSKSPFYDAREVRAAAYACSLSSLSQRRPSEVVLPTSKWLSVLLSVRNRSERSFSQGSSELASRPRYEHDVIGHSPSDGTPGPSKLRCQHYLRWQRR